MKYTFKDILKLIGLYALIYIICSAVFVGLFHTPILKGYDVLMYKGIGFIIVTGIIAAVLMGICRKLWNKVEIKDIIMDSESADGAVESLIERANYYGGNDNISVIVVSI